MNNNSNRVSRIIIFLSIIIAAISAYILLTTELADKPLAGHGDNLKGSSDIGGDFVLTDQNGEQFSSDQMKGRISLVYFGFTYCPDICPTSLQKLNFVIDTLEKYKIDILPIFISVDPNRDTPELLKEYLGHFNSKIIGLSGTEKQIREVADAYKVYYGIAQDRDTSDNHYMIDHSSFVYLMNKKGEYVKHFYLTSPAEEIIEFIRVNQNIL